MIHILPPPAKRFWLGFHGEPECSISINTAFGQNRKITHLPKLAQIVVYALKSELLQILVLPNMDDFPFPKLKGMASDKEIAVMANIKEGQQHPTPVFSNPSTPVFSNPSTPVITATPSIVSSAAPSTTSAATATTSLATPVATPSNTPPVTPVIVPRTGATHPLPPIPIQAPSTYTPASYASAPPIITNNESSTEKSPILVSNKKSNGEFSVAGEDEIELLDKEVEHLVNNTEKKEKEVKPMPTINHHHGSSSSSSIKEAQHNLRSNLQDGVVLLANLLGEKVSKRVHSH